MTEWERRLPGTVINLVDPPTAEAAAICEDSPFGKTPVDQCQLAEMNATRFSTTYAEDASFPGDPAGPELYYYGMRYYSPELGRWLNRDPLGESWGRNLYLCVRNCPISEADILGLTLLLDGDPESVAEARRIWDRIVSEATGELRNFLDDIGKPGTETRIRLVRNGAGVQLGNFWSGAVNWDAFKLLPETGGILSTSSWLLHEVSEQYYRQVEGIRDFEVAHDKAITRELAISTADERLGGCREKRELPGGGGPVHAQYVVYGQTERLPDGTERERFLVLRVEYETDPKSALKNYAKSIEGVKRLGSRMSVKKYLDEVCTCERELTK